MSLFGTLMHFFSGGGSREIEVGDLHNLLILLLLLFLLTILIYLVYSGILTPVLVETREPYDWIFGKEQEDNDNDNDNDNETLDDLVFDELVEGGSGSSSSSGGIVAYKTGRGPYKLSNWIYTEAWSISPSSPTIGIFYDDPDSTPENELRYAVGSLLNSRDSTLLRAYADEGYKIAHFPRPGYVVTASFPFRTTLSIYFAIFKVYPKLKSYIASRGLCAYPAIELYKDSQIHFMMPLSRQDEFYVPEFSEEEVSIATTEVSSNFLSLSENADRQQFIAEHEVVTKDDDGFVKPRIPKASFSSRQQQQQQQTSLQKKVEKSSLNAIEPKNDSEESGTIDRSDSASSFEDIGAATSEFNDDIAENSISSSTVNSQ